MTLISPDSLKSPDTGFLDQDPRVAAPVLPLRLPLAPTFKASGVFEDGLELFSEIVFMFLQDRA